MGVFSKNETLCAAQSPILNDELGIDINYKEISFLGNSEYFNYSSAFSDSVGTHYVYLLYRYNLASNEELDFESIDNAHVGHPELIWVDLTRRLEGLNFHHHPKQNLRYLTKT